KCRTKRFVVRDRLRCALDPELAPALCYEVHRHHRVCKRWHFDVAAMRSRANRSGYRLAVRTAESGHRETPLSQHVVDVSDLCTGLKMEEHILADRLIGCPLRI